MLLAQLTITFKSLHRGRHKHQRKKKIKKGERERETSVLTSCVTTQTWNILPEDGHI
jgi:hypothetical protein